MPVTKKPWFGPKRYLGWGWTVASWEGLVAAVVFLALIAASSIAWQGTARLVSVIVLLVLFGVLVGLTGGRPGGPGRRR